MQLRTYKLKNFLQFKKNLYATNYYFYRIQSNCLIHTQTQHNGIKINYTIKSGSSQLIIVLYFSIAYAILKRLKLFV